jgi:hypothetical protein
MGLFDFFLNDEKKIAKHQRRLTNRDSQPEDREASARWLVDQGSPQSLLALLARFDVSLDHQLKDKSEKDLVYALASSQGEDLLEPLAAWLKKCRSVALPLRLLEDLSGKEPAIDMVCELLELEHARDDFKPTKKKALLIWLAGVRHEKCLPTAALFLDDFDEGVRYAGAEVIIAQKGDVGTDSLLSVLTNPEEESNRLKVRICEIFAQRKWGVGDAAPQLAETLPENYRVAGGRVMGI